MAANPKPTRNWLARAHRALGLGAQPADLVARIRRGVPPLPGPRAWAVGCLCPPCRSVDEPRTVVSRCPIHWQAIHRVLKQIDPRWSGKMPRLVEPVPTTLPDGRTPVDLLLDRRRPPGSVGREILPQDTVGREDLDAMEKHLEALLLRGQVEVVMDLKAWGFAGGWADGPTVYRPGTHLWVSPGAEPGEFLLRGREDGQVVARAWAQDMVGRVRPLPR